MATRFPGNPSQTIVPMIAIDHLQIGLTIIVKVQIQIVGVTTKSRSIMGQIEAVPFAISDLLHHISPLRSFCFLCCAQPIYFLDCAADNINLDHRVARRVGSARP